MFDINLLNWIEKYANECKYFKIVTKCLKYENIKIKDILIDIIQSFLIEQAHTTEEFLKQIMESGNILTLKKPNVNDLYLEMIANMSIFKEFAHHTQNPWEPMKDFESRIPEILNKIKDNHKNNKVINEIITEVLENENKENKYLICDFCNRYEEEFKKIQNEVLEKEKKDIEEMEKQYKQKLNEISNKKKMCLLGIPVYLAEMEVKLEEKKNNYLKEVQEKRKKEMPYGHLFNYNMKNITIKGVWPEKKKEIEKRNFKAKINIYS